MVKPLVHDPVFLSIKSKTASQDDKNTAVDLLDTLKAHKDTCVGMAANMIGVSKRIIAFSDIGDYTVMYNPEIIKTSNPYETKESCLSLLGEPRKINRFRNIKVRYFDVNFKVKIKSYQGFTAQIIQHEIDHCNGVLI